MVNVGGEVTHICCVEEGMSNPNTRCVCVCVRARVCACGCEWVVVYECVYVVGECVVCVRECVWVGVCVWSG